MPVARCSSVLRRDLVSRDGYLIVLIMVLLTVIMIAIDDSFRGGQVVSAFMLGLLVLTTLSRSHVSHTLRLFGAVVTGGAVAAAIAADISGHTASAASHASPEWVFALGAGLYTLLLALLFPAILRQAFSHRTVNLNTVAAVAGRLPAARADLRQRLPVRADRRAAVLQPAQRQRLHLHLLQLRHPHHRRLRRLHRRTTTAGGRWPSSRRCSARSSWSPSWPWW